jgi:hypothetical protein
MNALGLQNKELQQQVAKLMGRATIPIAKDACMQGKIEFEADREGYDYAGSGAKRESEDYKRLLFCLQSITNKNGTKAAQLLLHLEKNCSLVSNSLDPLLDSILEADPAAKAMGRLEKIALLQTKSLIADRIAAAVQMLKGAPSAYEVFAKSVRGPEAGGHAVVEKFISGLWRALDGESKRKWNDHELREYATRCEANRLAYKLALVLSAPPRADKGDPAGKGKAVAKVLGVRSKRAGAGSSPSIFQEAQKLRAQLDSGSRKVWMPDERARRKDRLSDLITALAQRFWTTECPAMPGGFCCKYAHTRIPASSLLSYYYYPTLLLLLLLNEPFTFTFVSSFVLPTDPSSWYDRALDTGAFVTIWR